MPSDLPPGLPQWLLVTALLPVAWWVGFTCGLRRERREREQGLTRSAKQLARKQRCA